MALPIKDAMTLLSQLDADLHDDGRLGLPRRYLLGKHDLPYAPKGARQEFIALRNRAVTNWIPNVPDAYTETLKVEGYRAPKAKDNARAWEWWQANGLDARQSVAHGGALKYGVSYVLVLPGKMRDKPVPYIRPLDPLKSAAWYADDNDEFPAYGLHMKGKDPLTGARTFDVYDATTVTTYREGVDGKSDPAVIGTATHSMRAVPFVRFRDRLDGEAIGVIRPLKIVQDRVNEIVFSALIALQYAAFRQRWATGLAIPEDEDGNPKEPFSAAVDRLWVADDPEAKFGDFAQTDIRGHLDFYDDTVKTFAALAHVNPNLLTGADLVNVSAEAMAQMEASTRRRAQSFELIFGEAWEMVFRLAAVAAGESPEENDAAQIRWRDSEAHAFKETVEGLAVLAEKLGVPPEALWEKIPNVDDTDLQRWREIADREDPLSVVAAEARRQTELMVNDVPPEEP